MYYAVRCPRCLLTIYTNFVDDGLKGITVVSLADENLAFYNCPLAICEYHVDTNHNFNLYVNCAPGHNMSVSPGFTVAPRTARTRPCRSQSQVAVLALTPDNELTLDPAQDELQKPPMLGERVATKAQTDKAQTNRDKPAMARSANPQPAKAQPAKDVDEKEEEDDAAVPAVACANKSSRGMKWTVSEVKKLTHLVNEGHFPDEIAEEIERSASGVKNKISVMRERGLLPPAHAIKKRD